MSDDWIEHDGGPCPVDPETIVRVRFEDGAGGICHTRAYFWEKVWDIRNGLHGIIQYQVVRS